MSYYEKIYEYAANNYGLITSTEARTIGIPNVELVKLAGRGRLTRIGHGVYRIYHYVPTPLDKYAEAVAMVGADAYIYGESVLALHGLALVNPTTIRIAVPTRVRKKLPSFISVIVIKDMIGQDITSYEGIPSQSVFSAIIACKATVMTERLEDAVREAQKQGLITKIETGIIKRKLNSGN